MERDYSGELLRFIQEHPSVYHVIEGQRRILLEAGYEQLLESQHWTLREGGKYFLTRNHSALIAFQVPKKRFRGFMLMASHSDSPALKVKENPEITVGGLYKKLNVELYGGALLAPWLDRPLSVAGRLLVRTSEGVRMQLVNVDRDLFLSPSLAIHMNRSVNDGYAYKVQRDLLPLYGAAEAPDLTALVAETAGISPESVIGHDRDWTICSVPSPPCAAFWRAPRRKAFRSMWCLTTRRSARPPGRELLPPSWKTPSGGLRRRLA